MLRSLIAVIETIKSKTPESYCYQGFCKRVVPAGLFPNLFIEDLKKLADVFQLLRLRSSFNH
jgi:hypothetical protein